MQNTVEKIIKIIRENFPNGIRDDFIDTGKVLKIFAASNDGKNVLRGLISEVIHTNGIEDGGRFYFISENDTAKIRDLLNEILAENPIVYYSVVYEKHSDFFSRLHIFSPDVLKKIVCDADKNFYFNEFCAPRRNARLKYEVAKIFMASEDSISLDELQEQFPYVPAEKISAVLADEKKYLKTTAGKFVYISKIQFDTDEINGAYKKISERINAATFATFEDINLEINFELNYEVSERDLRLIIFKKFFAKDFVLRGKKIFRQGHIDEKNSLRPSQIYRAFVKSHDEVTLDQLRGVTNDWQNDNVVALFNAYKYMIRVERNLFVKDALINFDVDRTDAALMPFVQDKIIPLRAVTSFTGFPPVAGYSWNLFMLESFLLKYSKIFTYDKPALNNSNIGAIYPKSMQFKDYLQVQAAVLLQENIPLEIDAVGDFLIGNGFRSMRKIAALQNIISAAQESFH